MQNKLTFNKPTVLSRYGPVSADKSVNANQFFAPSCDNWNKSTQVNKCRGLLSEDEAKIEQDGVAPVACMALVLITGLFVEIMHLNFLGLWDSYTSLI